MKSKVKGIYLTLAVVFLTIVAVVAGLGLAIFDTETTVQEVAAMVLPDGESDEVREKQTIEISEGHISDIIDDNMVPSANVDHKIKDDISAGFKPLDPSAGEGNISSISENGGIKSATNQAEQSTDTDTKPDEKIKEEYVKEPLKITAEISGISTIVRAGDEGDMIENQLPAPAQITDSSDINVDPLKDYPLPYTEVDISYFDDALFIGDSRVAGLAMNSGTNATFYAVTSFQLYRYKTFKVVQTPNGKVPIFDVMPYDKFTKIYIKVGLNELGSVTDEPFLDAYTSLINDLRAMQPRAIIYIQAILPVTQVKSQTDRVHCNENIAKRNENLKSFAEVMKCYYVDVGPYFADETGALRAETTADGIHMYGKYMPQWIDALRKNAVIWPQGGE